MYRVQSGATRTRSDAMPSGGGEIAGRWRPPAHRRPVSSTTGSPVSENRASSVLAAAMTASCRPGGVPPSSPPPPSRCARRHRRGCAWRSASIRSQAKSATADPLRDGEGEQQQQGELAREALRRQPHSRSTLPGEPVAAAPTPWRSAPGFFGSRSILRRSRLTWLSTARSNGTAPPAPGQVEQLVAREHHAGALQQRHQQPELARGQRRHHPPASSTSSRRPVSRDQRSKAVRPRREGFFVGRQALRARRSTALMRASSSRGLNGLAT